MLSQGSNEVASIATEGPSRSRARAKKLMSHPAFTVTSTGFIGRFLSQKATDKKAYTLDELRAQGFRVIQWNGR